MHDRIDPRLRRAPLAGKARAWRYIACALMFALCYSLCAKLAQNPSSDLSIHIAWASEASLARPKTLTNHVAHPLWHTLTLLLSATGLPLNVAASLVTALCKAAEVALLRRLYATALNGRASEGAVTLAALATALVSAVCVPGFNNAVYIAEGGLCVGTPNTWHNPTQLIAMVFMLIGVRETARCWTWFTQARAARGDRATVPWRNVVALGALLAASLLAKPTFMQAFLPAACVFFGVKWLENRHNSRFFGQMLLAAAPSILMMLVQAVFYFGFAGVQRETGMTVRFAPDKLKDVLISFVMMRAFPLFALAVFARRKALSDPLARLTLLFDAVAVLEAALLTETGQRAADGNFNWAQMGSALMLWAVGMTAYLDALCVWREGRKKKPTIAAGDELNKADRIKKADRPGRPDRPMRPAWPLWVATALLLWHLASGVWYIVRLFTSGAAL